MDDSAERLDVIDGEVVLNHTACIMIVAIGIEVRLQLIDSHGKVLTIGIVIVWLGEAEIDQMDSVAHLGSVAEGLLPLRLKLQVFRIRGLVVLCVGLVHSEFRDKGIVLFPVVGIFTGNPDLVCGLRSEECSVYFVRRNSSAYPVVHVAEELCIEIRDRCVLVGIAGACRCGGILVAVLRLSAESMESVEDVEGVLQLTDFASEGD